MNRSLVIIIALFLVLIIVIGAVLFLLRGGETTPTPTSPTTSGSQQTPQSTYPSSYSSGVTNPAALSQAQAAVQAAYRSELAKHPGDNTQLYATVVVGDYALQVWAGDVMGGEALMRYEGNTRTWALVDAGGGQWSAEGLITAGVPQSVANDLIKGLGR